jgi:alkylhydroperoxidase/carboxymuconolactone decarboxylase family protein YurZ
LADSSSGSVGGAYDRTSLRSRAGASREEIVEVIGVAVMMGGGPSVVYGCQALEAVDQFEGAAA